MTDFIDRTTELKRYFPKPFYNLKDGQGLSILIEAVGAQLTTATNEVANARDQFLLARATKKYLEDHGVNLDVFKPRGYKMPDSVYRELIKIVTNSPKNIERIFERILALYFGDNAIDIGLANVYSYRPNEMIVELKANALIIASSRDLYGTHYLHRDHGGYDGDSIDLWNDTLPVSLSAGATGFTLAAVPSGMPTDGLIHFGPASSPDEIKGFTRVGNVVTFTTPTKNPHTLGSAINGPKFPDDYPNGYVYDAEIRTDLVGSYAAGVSAVQIGAFQPERLPLEGVVYLGNPENSNFEAKGYTRASLSSVNLTLKGVTTFAHSSGDSVIIPNFPRKIKTQLNQNITAGQSFSELTVLNGADFGIERGAIRLNQSFGNVEIVPFISRKLSDNTKLLIDPGYTFQFDHMMGEKLQLMARKTRPSTDGLNWPFYLNDTDSLRQQFFNLLRRLKATGVKIVFELL